MSLLSRGLGKLKGVGKLLKKAAPILGALPIPGISTAVAAGIGGLGGLIEGGGDSASGKGNWGGAAKSGAVGAGMGALGSIGGNLIGKGIKGIGGALASKVGGAGGGGGGGGEDGGNYDPTGGMRPDNPGNFANMGGGGGTDWTKIINIAGKVAPLAMGAAGAFQNAQQATQNRQLTQEQVAQAREAIARQRMLQDRALQPINVAAPDYTSIFAQTQNPFYRPGGP